MNLNDVTKAAGDAFGSESNSSLKKVPGNLKANAASVNSIILRLPEKSPTAAGHFVRHHNHTMKYVFATLILCSSLLVSATHAQGDAQMQLPRTQISVGFYQIDAQLARTPQQHEIGLMYRKEMPQQEGMLFMFDSPRQQCFWMKNTQLPLTAAFVADDGLIVNLADMKPQTLDSHCSLKPVRYVLEMNQGWFAKKGIKAGMKLNGQPFTPRP